MRIKTLLKLSLLCILAAFANFFLHVLVASPLLRAPLFLDTLFNVSVTFAAGLFPGIISAIITTLGMGLYYKAGYIYLFGFCSIAEVFLVWAFQRRTAVRRSRDSSIGRASSYASISTAASLLLLALVDCIAISILGGLIDYFILVVVSMPRVTYSPEDVFKMGLLRNNIPLLWANILSRFPINLVDRLVVIAGGYGVSRIISRAFPAKTVR